MGHPHQIRQILLSVVVRNTTTKFWSELKAGLEFVYSEAYDANLNNGLILQHQSRFKTTNDRHFMAEKVFSDVSLNSGNPPLPHEIKQNIWNYTVVNYTEFSLTQKYVRDRDKMTAPAKFRKALAESGGISRQSEFFGPTASLPVASKVYNGILIHGPRSRNPANVGFTQLGFAEVAFPYEDQDDWAAKFSIDDLIAQCDNQGNGTNGENSSRGPNPTWKDVPDQEE